MKHDADAARHSATEPDARHRPARQKHPPKLDDEHREYIVRRLAAHERPSRIRREVRERFGIEVSHAGIDYYDPTRSAACGKQWADLFYTVRRAHAGAQSEPAASSRKLERLVLRTVGMLTDRILNGVQAEAQRCANDAGEITDEDRLRALVAFIERLKITNPPGVAEIRRVLLDDLGPQGAAPPACAPALSFTPPPENPGSTT
jgi:hypothetical protein